MNFTYNPNLAKVKVDLHTKNQGRRSNGLAVRAVTDGRTDRRTDRRTDATKYIISLASRSIIMLVKSDTDNVHYQYGTMKRSIQD